MYWMIAILGIVFLIAPFLLGYTANIPALLTSFMAGIVILAMSGLEFSKKEREMWEYWVAGATGLIVMVAPFILGYQAHISALWTSVILGAMVTILAGSKIYNTTNNDHQNKF